MSWLEKTGHVRAESTVTFAGIRNTIYRHRRLIKEGGIQALKRQVNEDHIHANRTDLQTTEALIEFSLDNPHLGQAQVSNHLKKNNRIEISASGVRDIWLRENMQTIALRLQKISELKC